MPRFPSDAIVRSALISLGALLSLGSLLGCREQAPWSGHYVLDLSSGVQQALTHMTEIAENRGVQIVETRPTRNAITLSLTVDGNFSFERELMGARTVSSGTYKVQDGVIVMTTTTENGAALDQPRNQTGRWDPGEISLEGWGVLRRSD